MEGVVEKLLELKADLHARLPSTGQTTLHVTAALGDLGVLRVLKAVGAELEATDIAGHTALHLACHAGHVKVVQELLEAGAIMDMDSASSPLELAAGCGTQSVEGKTGPPGSASSYSDIVKMLLEAKCALTPAALHAAAGAGAAVVVGILVQHGADVNSAGPTGSSPLLVALQKCNTPRTKDNLLGPQAEAARMLLKLGASPSTVRTDGVSALMLAAAIDDADLVETLVGAGAEVNLARGPQSSTCLVGSQTQEWKVIDQMLMRVEGASLSLPPGVLCPRMHPMERLSKARCHRRPHCDLCRKQELHNQPVYWTCWPCDHDLCIDCARVPPVVELRPGSGTEGLPELGEASRSSAFKTTAMDGWQPLHHAVVAGSVKSAKALMQAKADVLAGDAQGLTPLHWAAFLANGCVAELLAADADVTARDSEGRTSLELLPIESLRYAFESMKLDFKELCCHELRVTGSGPADGVYAVVRQDTKQAIPEPPARPPPPAPSAPATTEAEAATTEAEAEAPQPPETAPPPAGEEVGEEPPPAPLEQDSTSSSTPSRPRYHRVDGAPFIIKWDETNGWGLFQSVVPMAQEICVFKSSHDTLFCPADGWAPDERVQLEEKPDVRVEELPPYRWGTLLFKHTPAELRPPHLQEEVEKLPEIKATSAVSRILLPGMPPMQISLTGGAGGVDQRALQMVMQQMGEPSCPVS